MKFVEYAKILKFPDKPEEVKDLLAQEQVLLEDLGKGLDYSDRVETRNLLKEVSKIRNGKNITIRGHFTEKYKNSIGQNVTILW